MTNRLDKTFAALKEENRAALVTYFMAGDPGYDASLELLKAMPEAGADVIELGMPFTDPMADGPAIQEAGQRALKHGIKLREILESVAAFRAKDADTPVVLMGYYNPIYSFGVEAFLAEESGDTSAEIENAPAAPAQSMPALETSTATGGENPATLEALMRLLVKKGVVTPAELKDEIASIESELA